MACATSLAAGGKSSIAAPLSSEAPFAPITIPADAKTSRDFEAAHRAWAERVFLVPFRERARGMPWSEDALAFAGAALDDWAKDRPAPRSAELDAQGAAVLARSCTDPLVAYLAAWARWRHTGQRHEARTAFRRILPEAEKLTGSRILARTVAAEFIQVSRPSGRDVADAPTKLADYIGATARDGSYTPEEAPIFVRHLLGDRWDNVFEHDHRTILATLREADLPRWVMATLKGAAEVELAWEERGGDVAPEVPEAGWRGFAEHLRAARKALTEAWRLNPQSPFAATKMIVVAMGGGAGPGESERVWFDRVISAECDYFPAYKALALATMPRWGGSHRQMLEFARACLATGRFDTEAPLGYFAVLSTMNQDQSDMAQLYRQPAIAADVLRLSQALVDEPKRSDEKRMRLSYLAVNAWMTGEASRAANALQLAGPARLHPAALEKLRDADMDETGLRGLVATLAGTASGEYRAGDAAWKNGDFPAALTAFQAALAKAQEPAAAFLRAKVQTVEAEQKMRGGEWTSVPPDQTLAGWLAMAGVWKATPEGFPECSDTDGQARIFHGTRLGQNFEMRGELGFRGEATVGVYFARERADENWETWQGCQTYPPTEHRAKSMYVFNDGYTKQLAEIDCELREVNEFYLRIENGRLTWKWNGKTIYENAPLPHEIPEEGGIGFGGFAMRPGGKITLRRLEARCLPGTKR